MRRMLAILIGLGIWSGHLALAAGPEILDVSGTYETLMDLIEKQKVVAATVDLDKVPLFRLYDYRPGMYYLYSGRHHQPHLVDKARKVVVLIHGMDEPGQNWDTAVRLLAREPDLLVFFFIWTKWNRPHSLEYWIGRNIGVLARAFSNKVPEMDVLAHSAGGLLMLQALCQPDASRLCAYDPTQIHDIRVRFHTIASPLGGFGMRGTALASLFAGPVTAHVGSRVYFQDILPDLDLTVWYTTFEDDGVLRQTSGQDMRFPRFTDAGIPYKKVELPGCSHDDAILQGVLRIFGLQPPAGLPGVKTWKPLYRNDGQVTPHEPRRGNEWKRIEFGPRQEKARPLVLPSEPKSEWREVDEAKRPDGGDGGGAISGR